MSENATLPLHRLHLRYEQTMDRLREKYADTPAGYHDLPSRERAAARIEKCREECRIMDGGIVTSAAYPLQPFAGRQRQLEEIGRCFREGHRIVLISGMGGIGKTSLLTAYARRSGRSVRDSEYDAVLFLPVGDGVRKAVADDTVLRVSGLRWSARGYRSRQAYYRAKMKALTDMARSKRLLLLLDDIRAVRPRELAAVLKVPADILISSRLTGQAFGELPEELRPRELPLAAMSDEELAGLAALLRPDLSPEAKNRYRMLCAQLQGHTLSLKLWLTSDAADQEAAAGVPSYLEAHLGRGGRLLLMALAVLPPEGVLRSWAERVCGSRSALTERLSGHSLVQLFAGEDGRQRISLHPLIAEEVRKTLKPGIKNCRHFIEGVAADVSNAWNEPREEMLLRLPAVQSLLHFFKERPAWLASTLDKLLTYLWVMEEFEDSEKGYLDLYHSVANSFGETSQEAGWIAVRTAAVYHNSLRFEEAERWYRRGLDSLRAAAPKNRDYWWQRMEACGKCTRGPWYRGETEEVLALLDEAAEVYRSAPEEARNEQLLLIETYHSRQQALVRLRLGRTEEAEQYRKRMHEEMELYFRRCGTDGPRLLDLRETDIEFERAAGNLSEAARHLEENMRGYVLYRGPEHEDTLKCMEQLADILSDGSRARENLREDLRRARGLYLQVAAGVRSHYPYESEWLLRVEKKIRKQMIQGL